MYEMFVQVDRDRYVSLVNNCRASFQTREYLQSEIETSAIGKRSSEICEYFLFAILYVQATHTIL